MIKKIASDIISRIRYKNGKNWKLRGTLLNQFNPKLNNYWNQQENQKNLVFMIGTGRSGTQLLSKVMEKAENISSWHEPDFNEDIYNMEAFRNNHELALEYIKDYRSLKIAQRWIESKQLKYSESSGTIRYLTPALIESFPYANFFLESRDGRDVVRSIMRFKQFYSKNSTGAYNITPLKNDKFYDDWKDMSRFEKICWNWMDSYNLLMNHIDKSNWVKLELFVKDYNYANTKLFQKTGIQISEEIYYSVVNKKSSNTTKKHEFPKWENWTDSQQESFNLICGETMKKLGYQY